MGYLLKQTHPSDCRYTLYTSGIQNIWKYKHHFFLKVEDMCIMSCCLIASGKFMLCEIQFFFLFFFVNKFFVFACIIKLSWLEKLGNLLGSRH